MGRMKLECVSEVEIVRDREMEPGAVIRGDLNLSSQGLAQLCLIGHHLLVV